jgi:hypothetical protein
LVAVVDEFRVADRIVRTDEGDLAERAIGRWVID